MRESRLGRLGLPLTLVAALTCAASASAADSDVFEAAGVGAVAPAGCVPKRIAGDFGFKEGLCVEVF